MGSFETEGRWFMQHGSPGAFLIPVPLGDEPPMDLGTAVFVADCMSVDHDSPVVVRSAADNPAEEMAPIEPLFPSTPEADARMYSELLGEALGDALEMRVGFGSFALRYQVQDPLAHFTTRLSGVEEAVGLYAMATRQVDVLGEYLCLYRLLEWPEKDNGKRYIERHLETLRRHDFGVLDAYAYHAEAPINVFEVYRGRALARIDAQRASGKSDSEIAAHLYSIRNSLAHGKKDFLVGRTVDVAEVGREVPIVKMLARLVVDGLR